MCNVCDPTADDYSWKPACKDKRPRTPADSDILVMAVRTRANAQAAEDENRGMF